LFNKSNVKKLSNFYFAYFHFAVLDNISSIYTIITLKYKQCLTVANVRLIC